MFYYHVIYQYILCKAAKCWVTRYDSIVNFVFIDFFYLDYENLVLSLVIMMVCLFGRVTKKSFSEILYHARIFPLFTRQIVLKYLTRLLYQALSNLE